MYPKKQESGYVLVVLAFILVIVLGFAAMAVDMGILYSSHTAAQRAADAAALAGAFTFITSPGATDPVALATNRALQTAKENQILGQNVQDAEVGINVNYPMRRVTVDVTRTADTYFAKALYFGSATVHAQGIAEASQTATGSKCVKPWFVPNSLLASVNPCYACQNPADNLVVLPNGNVRNDALLSSNRGAQFTLKAGSPGGAIASGQFYAIDVTDSQTGGDVYREAIALCRTEMQQYCLASYSTKTGNMVGPTKQGVEGGANLTDQLMNSPADTWAGFVDGSPTFYKNGDTSKRVVTSKQLVVAPLWNVCTATLDCSNMDNPKFPPGTNAQIQVIGFALLLVEGMNGNDVMARILDIQACGSTPPVTTETGPFSVPLRLVRLD